MITRQQLLNRIVAYAESRMALEAYHATHAVGFEGNAYKKDIEIADKAMVDGVDELFQRIEQLENELRAATE